MKYVIHQKTQKGQIITPVGDHQQVTISTHSQDSQFPLTSAHLSPDLGTESEAGGEDIIAPVGKKIRFFSTGSAFSSLVTWLIVCFLHQPDPLRKGDE